MPRDELLSDVERYYSAKLREHGATAAGVDWNGEPSQRLRFEQLLRIVEEPSAGTLIDWGCGYGALAEHIGHGIEYWGHDVSPEMLAAANERLGGRARLTADPDALPVADYVVASGVFNVKQGTDSADWEAYVCDTLDQLAAHARRGFAFNMLTSWSDADRMRADLYYGDPCKWFSHCKRNYARNVALLHDYGLYEFTVLVRVDVP
ncbi:MAG TPA: class I SAM-dependent methyltransferase [Thermoleophilaceae bacterium]|jgi:SAM-dependent methyltransferase